MRMWWCAVLLSTSISATAQNVPVTVSGRVTEVGSGQPIQGFRVGMGEQVGSWDYTRLQSVRTDANGEYRITFMVRQNSAINIWTEDQRYPGYAWPGTRFHYDGPEDQTWRRVRRSGVADTLVGSGATFSNVDFNVDRPATLSGRLMEDGRPVDNASVRISGAGLVLGAETLSDADGRFRLGRMHPGTVSLSVTKSGYLTSRHPDVLVDGLGQVVSGQAPTSIELVAEQARDVGDMPMRRGYRLLVAGRSMGAYVPINPWVRGTTVANSVVNLSMVYAHGQEYFLHVEEDGAFRGVAYPAVSCAQWPCPGATPFRWDSGEPPVVTLDLTPRQIVTGTVRDASGAPIAGAFVRSASRIGFLGTFVQLHGVAARTDASGRYRLPGVWPGQPLIAVESPTLEARATTLYPDVSCLPLAACNDQGGSPVSVAADQTTEGVDITVSQRGARMVARLTLSRLLREGEDVHVRVFQRNPVPLRRPDTQTLTLEVAGEVLPPGVLQDVHVDILRDGGRSFTVIDRDGRICRGEHGACRSGTFRPRALTAGEVQVVDFGTLDLDEYLNGTGFW